MKSTAPLIIAAALPLVASFSVQPQQTAVSSTVLAAAKGFSKEPAKVPSSKNTSAGQAKRNQQSAKYDEISGSGGQEYSIFVRQFGQEQGWLPCGSVAVPRGGQVADAIFSNTEALQASIVRTFPKMKGCEAEFEYGYNLKIYPDDPIEIAVNGGVKASGPSVGNWISNLLSPIDDSKLN